MDIIFRIFTSIGVIFQYIGRTEILIPFLLIFIATIILLKILHIILVYNHQIRRSLDKVLLRVSLPKISKQGEEQGYINPIEQIALAEEFFQSIHGLFKVSVRSVLFEQDRLSFEIVAVDNIITFYIASPRRYVDIVKKQLNSFYPEAVIEPVVEYNIFKPGSKIVAAEYDLGAGTLYPIMTYPKQSADPLGEITNAFTKQIPGEAASLQVMFYPITTGWHRKGANIIKRIERLQGIPTKSRFIRYIDDSTKFVASLFVKAKRHEMTEDEILVAQAVKEKIKKDGFRVAIRVVAAAPTAERASQRLQVIESTFAQFDWPRVNRLRRNPVFFKKRFITDYIFRFFPIFGKTIILNTEEIATICHFPDTGITTPGIHWLGPRTAPPPANLPREGSLLGVNVYRGNRTLARIAQDDKRRHMYIVGKTGMGKSTLIENMALYDIYDGKGVGIVDPHGDLTEAILKKIPKNRVQDVVLFDPSDIDRPLGLNLLEYKTKDQENFVIQETINIFYKLFYEFAGPKFEHSIRNAILTLLADKQHLPTVVDIPRLFIDQKYAEYKAQFIQNPVVRSFWTDEMAVISPEEKSETIGPIVEKIEAFSEDEILQPIIGQSKSTIDFDDIINSGKIMLINLSKGKIGELNSAFLGLIFVTKFYMAVMKRAEIPEERRNDFMLYIDEFQNFTTASISTIFSEARKYRLNLIVSHQYIGQLTDDIRKSIFGNVGSLITFRVGNKDAQFLGPEFQPQFSSFDLVNLSKYSCYLKLMIDGKATDAFSLLTLPPSQSESEEAAHNIRNASREMYGIPITEVRKEIDARLMKTS